MKDWIDAVGYGLPACIQLSKTDIYKGNPLWAVWYGRFSLSKSSWQKMRLILQNGNYSQRKH